MLKTMKIILKKSSLLVTLPLCWVAHLPTAQAQMPTWGGAKDKINLLFNPSSPPVNQVQLQVFRQLPLELGALQEFPQSQPATAASQHRVELSQAIQQALQRRPEITRSVASLAGQSANIDTAKAQYYPQISGGISSADLTTGERGRQVYNLSASQVLYDFGKIKSSVDVEQAKLLQEQAETLLSIDELAFQTANAIVNVNRYQELVKIAQQQIQGLGRIAEIANLRAKAGISSQADPIQAQSNVEAAQSNLLMQQTQLHQYQQKLRTLLGYDVNRIQFDIPDAVIRQAGLYQEPDFVQIPQMMSAQAAVQVAQFQKQETKLSSYPSIQVKGSLSQALNGKNPNNNKDDGMYSSVMLEANSNFFQGGATRSRLRAASYAEEAAKAEVQTVYLDVLDQVRLIREQVENKQQQMQVLTLRKQTTARTKELYQEQYKLGTRTVVDLLNSEQAIHSVAQDIENARYDIYAGLVQYLYITGRSRDVYHLNHLSIQGFEIQP